MRGVSPLPVHLRLRSESGSVEMTRPGVMVEGKRNPMVDCVEPFGYALGRLRAPSVWCCGSFCATKRRTPRSTSGETHSSMMGHSAREHTPGAKALHHFNRLRGPRLKPWLT